jgi:hypothetical protein
VREATASQIFIIHAGGKKSTFFGKLQTITRRPCGEIAQAGSLLHRGNMVLYRHKKQGGNSMKKFTALFLALVIFAGLV